jgi:serine/threonine-protein kinase
VSVSLEQFVQKLTQSGLMSATDVSSFHDSLPPEKRPKDGEALARELVRANKLTKYQAQAVYQGKVKGLVFGDYRVLDKLGQGGMGVVLKAEHRRMKRVVAVKMISGAALKSPDAVKRFYREVEAAAKLEHTNIVTAHDAGEHEGGHYLVMQYVDGQDLGAIVKERGPLPVAETVEYVLQAARGLEYAHKRNVVHRDIKPGNLLVDGEGTVKILDMGLARVGTGAEQEEDRLTASGQVMGTCDYMAPEQALDTHHADQRADIYSLGCTLYRLLAGEVLYKGDSLTKILIAHQLSPVPSLRQARGDVSPQLDGVFQKMVAKKPEDRYQSMTEVIAALETCAGKGAATSTSVGAERTAAFPLEESLSFLQDASPVQRTTATKKKVEKLTEATIVHQAAPGETSRQFAGGEKIQPAARKKKTLFVAVALGLLGVMGIAALAVIIRIRHRDGSETAIHVPEGSEVTVSQDGGRNAPPLAVAPFDDARAKQHQEAWAKHLGVPVEQTNSIGMKLALIPPGEFGMGSTPEEVQWALEYGGKNKIADNKYYFESVPTEAPRHRVKITRPFYLGTYPVTQAEYQKVVGVNPSSFTEKQADLSVFKPPPTKAELGGRMELRMRALGMDTDRHPVEMLNWDDCVEFCRKLSAMPAERVGGSASGNQRVYRLPTEAEWEYACRAGTTTRWHFGDDEAGLDDAAWFLWNSRSMTHPVGQKKPNAWGLYDMYGNVYQWCADWFGARYYQESPISDPAGPAASRGRVQRGGWFRAYLPECRSAFRNAFPPGARLSNFGFRVAAEVAAGGPQPDHSWNVPAFRQWMRSVAALPTEKQIEAVGRKLMELNPGFDGKLTGFDEQGGPKCEGGAVTELAFGTNNVTDISPVRALAGLKSLGCRGAWRNGRLSDLSPLEGMQLAKLDCMDNNALCDLSPLRGMPLVYLSCHGTRLSDLSPLRGMPLTYLNCAYSPLSDLSPLRGMPLTTLDVGNTPVSDLSALGGIRLTNLSCNSCGKIVNLSPLRGMPLTRLDIRGTRVADLSPLEGMPLFSLYLSSTSESDLSPLQQCKGLAHLDIKNAKVTPAGVAALQKALPNCKIEWDDPARPGRSDSSRGRPGGKP